MHASKIRAWLADSHNIVVAITTAASFALIYRPEHHLKPFELLIILAGGLLVFKAPGMLLAKKLWLQIRSYTIYIVLMIAFIVLGQILSYQLFGGNLISTSPLGDYARVILNGGVFLLMGGLICFSKKILRSMSVAIFMSPVVVLPAFFSRWEKYYLDFPDGHRLAGFMQNPLNFSGWLVPIFLIGLGLFFASRRAWQKTLIVFWLAVIATFLLWSASRAAWLSLAVGLALLIIYFLWQKNVKKVGWAISITIVAFLAGYLALPLGTPGGNQTYVAERVVNFAVNPVYSQTRTSLWAQASGFITAHPLGLGFPTHTTEGLFGARPAANSFLELAFYGGLGAVMMFLLMLKKLGGDSLIALKKISGSDTADLKLVWLIAALMLLLDVFFTNGFLYRHLWFALGTAAGITWQKNSEEIGAREEGALH